MPQAGVGGVRGSLKNPPGFLVWASGRWGRQTWFLDSGACSLVGREAMRPALNGISYIRVCVGRAEGEGLMSKGYLGKNRGGGPQEARGQEVGSKEGTGTQRNQQQEAEKRDG